MGPVKRYIGTCNGIGGVSPLPPNPHDYFEGLHPPTQRENGETLCSSSRGTPPTARAAAAALGTPGQPRGSEQQTAAAGQISQDRSSSYFIL